MGKLKFEFGIDFQELILKYTVTEKKGYKALELYEDGYFGLLEHQVIAFALKKYYKKRKRVPEEPYLRETIRVLYVSSSRDLFSALTDDDRATIDNVISRIYQGGVADSDTVLDKCINFARYAKFKDEMEKVDINKYDSYSSAVEKLNAANSIGAALEDDYGTSVVAGIHDRAYKRDILTGINPTPFWQFNRLLNSGGLTMGAVVLIAAQAKRFKTGFLINICKSLMKRKRRIIYFDFENGESALTTRSEQSIIGVSQEEVTSGDMDEKLLKILRKYKRLGAELIIKRMVAYSDTTIQMQAFIDKCKRDLGITFTDCIIDYPDLQAATSGKTDEFNRISDAYVDNKNFAEKNQFLSTWVASHVKSEAKKRRSSRYAQEDLAKCIDKIRHVDCALGLQESDEEIENGVMRLEVIDQRNGMRDGKMLFWVDLKKQTIKEFTKAQVKEYMDQVTETKEKTERVSDI